MASYNKRILRGRVADRHYFAARDGTQRHGVDCTLTVAIFTHRDACRWQELVHLRLLSPLKCRVTPRTRNEVWLWVSEEDEALIHSASQELVPFLQAVALHRQEWHTLAFVVNLTLTGLSVLDLKANTTIHLPVAPCLDGVTLESAYMCALNSLQCCIVDRLCTRFFNRHWWLMQV